MLAIGCQSSRPWVLGRRIHRTFQHLGRLPETAGKAPIVDSFRCDSGSGGSASDVCDGCDNSSLRGVCEQVYKVCIQDDVGSSEDCAVAALLACGVV